jgi:hypothetical protein
MNINLPLKKYFRYLLLGFLLFNTMLALHQYQTENQKKQAKEHLETSFKELKKIDQKNVQKKSELEQVNLEVKKCLAQAKPLLKKCENLLAKSFKLFAEYKAGAKEYEQLLHSTQKDYCLIYPDAVDKNCQPVEK